MHWRGWCYARLVWCRRRWFWVWGEGRGEEQCIFKIKNVHKSTINNDCRSEWRGQPHHHHTAYSFLIKQLRMSLTSRADIRREWHFGKFNFLNSRHAENALVHPILRLRAVAVVLHNWHFVVVVVSVVVLALLYQYAGQQIIICLLGRSRKAVNSRHDSQWCLSLYRCFILHEILVICRCCEMSRKWRFSLMSPEVNCVLCVDIFGQWNSFFFSSFRQEMTPRFSFIHNSIHSVHAHICARDLNISKLRVRKVVEKKAMKKIKKIFTIDHHHTTTEWRRAILHH